MLIGKLRKYSNILQIADVVLRIVFFLCFSQYFTNLRTNIKNVLTTKTTQPRPQVFSVEGAIIWQF